MNMHKKIPILVISDSVTAPSGLARIARDICSRVAENMDDKFRLASVGYGSPSSYKLPFYNYHVDDPIKNGWQIPELPEIYDDWSGGEECWLLTIYDASRLLWLADPRYCTIPHLQNFIKDAPIKKLGYWPIDAHGVNGKLSQILAYTVSRFDKNLAYTQFGADVLDKTFPDKKHEFIYHGLDRSVFYPRPKKQSREKMSTEVFGYNLKNSFVIGSVQTNQIRKDLALLFATAKELLSRGTDVRLWLHTDIITRAWDINALVADFEMQGRVAITIGLDNESLATYYSACDITILSSLGEGVGYPSIESVACGTGCFTGDYGGTPELLLNKEHLVKPAAYRYESVYNNVRPVFRPEDFCDKIEQYSNIKPEFNDRLDWNNLWKNEWEPFFRGIS